MADFSIAITVADAKQADLIAMYRWKYGPYTDPNTSETRDRTPAELRALLKEDVIKMMEKDYRSWLAASADTNDPMLS